MQLNDVIKDLYKAIFPFGMKSIEYNFPSIYEIENSLDLDFLSKELNVMESYKRSFDTLMLNLSFLNDICITVNFKTKEDLANRVIIVNNDKTIDVYFNNIISVSTELNYHIINGEMLIIIEKIQERVEWLSTDIEISE